MKRGNQGGSGGGSGKKKSSSFSSSSSSSSSPSSSSQSRKHNQHRDGGGSGSGDNDHGTLGSDVAALLDDLDNLFLSRFVLGVVVACLALVTVLAALFASSSTNLLQIESCPRCGSGLGGPGTGGGPPFPSMGFDRNHQNQVNQQQQVQQQVQQQQVQQQQVQLQQVQQGNHPQQQQQVQVQLQQTIHVQPDQRRIHVQNNGGRLQQVQQQVQQMQQQAANHNNAIGNNGDVNSIAGTRSDVVVGGHIKIDGQAMAAAAASAGGAAQRQHQILWKSGGGENTQAPPIATVQLGHHVTTIDADILSHNVVDGPLIQPGQQQTRGIPTATADGTAGGTAGAGHPQGAGPGTAGGWSGDNNGGGGGGMYYYDSASQAHVLHAPPAPTPRKVFPSPCASDDGYTIGYSDWKTLRSAVAEANARSAEAFLRWNEYHAAMDEYERFPELYQGRDPPTSPDDEAFFSHGDGVEDDEGGPPTFVICPGVTLRTPRRARRLPIFVNAEDVLIECDGCTVDVGGTHLAFGPHARNVVVRGLTFVGARSSSLTFHHHGAEATFEDCYWAGNAGDGNAGAVADLNSTSSVSFYRCEISDTKQAPRAVGPQGGGFAAGAGGAPGVTSSLTIRN